MITFLIAGCVLIFSIFVVVNITTLKKQKQHLIEKNSALNEGLKANQVWVAKLAKMNPIDALGEIRKQDIYNQKVEGDRTY